MMRFNVGGQFLELPDNFSVQFKKTNILFAFDKAECERSASFDVPDTPTNDRIFGISKWIQTSGDGMRRRYDAQLQASGVTKDGYLYVDSYSKGKYKAVFVTGELLGLQAIRNAGKISDFMRFANTTAYSSIGIRPQSAETNIWAGVEYKRPSDALIRPSVQLGQLYAAIFAQLGVTHSQIPAAAASIRIIPNEIKGIQAENVTLTETARAMATNGTYPVCLEVSNSLIGDVVSYSTARVARRANGGATIYTGTARVFYARQNIEITFPEDWYDDLFIGRFLSGYYPQEEHLLAIFEFLGDRSFDRSKNVTGESLRGRSVEIEQGGTFLIISKDDYVYMQESGGLTEGWAISGGEFAVEIEGGEITSGAYVRLQDNLPDITAVDLLKYISAFSGRMLNYDDANGIAFDALDFDTWSNKELKDVIGLDNIARVFSDYAQRNMVQFTDKQGIVYTIDNDNISEEKELQSLPFVQGGGTADAIYIDDKTEGDVAGTNGGGNYLARVELPKNAGLQTLCDASTSVQVRARMTLLEFDHITPKTLIYYAGARYVWTEAQWSKGVVTLKLSKT